LNNLQKALHRKQDMPSLETTSAYPQTIRDEDAAVLSPARPYMVRSLAIGAQSIGALALGAFAIGALALGAVAIGRLAVGRARIRRLEIDELLVRNLRVTQSAHMPDEATQ
jgi:hypothetical protein